MKQLIVRSIRLVAALLVLGAASPSAFAPVHATPDWFSKLDPVLQERWSDGGGSSRVIIRTVDPAALSAVRSAIAESGGALGRHLSILNGQVAQVPHAALLRLASNPLVAAISVDRMVTGTLELAGASIGATAVRRELGLDGAGVAIATIDSGITAWHDDLSAPAGGQRVERFVDFVNGLDTPYDDYGHGTHVAGIIAGNGYDSGGARSGVAPGSRLVVLKVLDRAGRGRISDVIAALEYTIAHRAALNIRVVNLSVATGVFESYDRDPLTLATRRAVEAGVVVITSAGNQGASPDGDVRYRGITAPGNAPWVLTVGASTHNGTVDRADDTVAGFSSRGPAAISYNAKPDLLAPGVGIESLADPGSALYLSSPSRLDGTVATAYQPYLSLSGTSMAAPVVAGTVALMLQANPSLTPNAVKAILQFTSQALPDLDPLTQGAGFLNTKGAVELARHFANPAALAYPVASRWSKRLLWGNTLVKGGRLTQDATAWPLSVTWGASATPSGGTIDWGILCLTDDCAIAAGRWSAAVSKTRNVVWGVMCGGGDCQIDWTTDAVTGTLDGDTVVWGTIDDVETVVWGTIDALETVVWGTIEGETVVWGTSCGAPDCAPIIWPRQ
jgi:serine protease AprX